MKILYGVQQPDEGTITINGTLVALKSPIEAIKAATGVNYAVIEYDNAPGEVFEDIENSYRFLIDGGLAA